MTHSISPGHDKPAPRIIILDTRVMVRKMMAAMSAVHTAPSLEEVETGAILKQHFPHRAQDVVSLPLYAFQSEENFTKILDDVLMIISDRTDAELSLQYESMHMMTEHLKDGNYESMLEFSRFLVEFGMHLVRELELAGVYENGRMTYGYHGRVGFDVTLVQLGDEDPKFTVSPSPEIPDDDDEAA